MRRYTAIMTQRGQVTLPVPVRRVLGLKPRETVVFEVVGNEVRIVPAPFTVESVRGSVPALKEPKSIEEITTIAAIAAEEHARHVLDEMDSVPRSATQQH